MTGGEEGWVGARYPRRHGIAVVPAARASARAAITLYAPCRPAAVVLHAATWAVVAAVGGRALPGSRHRWDPPTGTRTWAQLLDAWRTAAGPIDDVVAAVPRQASRAASSAIALLLRDRRVVACAKVRPEPDALRREAVALRALNGAVAPGVRSPGLIADSDVGGWWWTLTSALPARPHLPVRSPDLTAIVGGLQRRLEPVIARPEPGTDPTWRPVHGDLAPWNLRYVVRGGVHLLDWEEVTWGPPAADLAYYAATAAVVLGHAPPVVDAATAEWWRQRIADRPGTDADRALNEALLRALRPGAGAGGSAGPCGAARA